MQMLVNIDVDDLDVAVGFYRAALGLRLGRRLFGGSVAEMLGASSNIYLLFNPLHKHRHFLGGLLVAFFFSGFDPLPVSL